MESTRWKWLVLAVALSGCPGPSSQDVDAAMPGDDAAVPGDDAFDPARDAGSSSDDAASMSDDASASDLCPTYDESDPSQVTLGRASSGPAVLDADTTWTADHTYFVIGSLDVQGIALTIEPGTHVCLDAGSGAPPTIDFRAGSSLDARGTAAAPIVFAPATPDSDWNSMTFSAMDTAVLEHVRLIGGGAGGAGVLRIEDGFADPFEARDVHVEDVHGLGISLRADVGLASDASVFVDSQRSGLPGPAIESTLLAAGTLRASTLHLAASLPADARRVQLTDDLIETDLTLHADVGVPFVTAGDVAIVRVDASAPVPTLTLEAGVRLLFAPDGELRVGDASGLADAGGNLVAVGTASAPVELGSAASTPAAGDWGGVLFYADAFDPAVTRIDHVTVSDAGETLGGNDILHCSTLPTPVPGAIRIRASASLPYEGPSLDAVSIVRSAGDGVAFTCLPTRCLTTDYTGHVSGTDVAGMLLRSRTCT